MPTSDEAMRRAFGQVLREARLRRQLTQEQVAHAASLGLNYVSELERGRRNPSLVTVFKLARGIGVRPELLVRKTSELAEGSDGSSREALHPPLARGPRG